MKLTKIMGVTWTCIFLLAGTALGFVRSTVPSSSKNNPTFRKWPDAAFPLTVRFSSEVTDSLPNVKAGSDVREAMRDSYRIWQDLPTSLARFNFQSDSAETKTKNDNINLITFTDSDLFQGNNALAIALTFSTTAGEIVESDIGFNPNQLFSTNGDGDRFDIQAVATHEVGHLLGLDHSPILAATMFPTVGRGKLLPRTLSTDDVIGASIQNPDGNFLGTTGKIRGLVTAGGSPVFGAHVVAIDASGRPAASALSLGDGSYTLEGLAPGNYQVVAEPLDQPVTEENIGGIFDNTVATNFKSTFLGGNNLPLQSVSVTAGGSNDNQNITLTAGTAGLNVTLAGIAPDVNSLTSFSGGLLAAGRGKKWGVGFASDSAQFKTEATVVEVSGTGLTVTKVGTFDLQGGGSGVALDVNVAADAAVGPRNIFISTSDRSEATLFMGGFEVTPERTLVFPRVQHDAATFTGLAFSNPSASAAGNILLTAYGNDGTVLSGTGIVNPASRFLFPGEQLAIVDSQLFGSPQTTPAWVEARVLEGAETVGFFLFLDSTNSVFTDGSDVTSSTATTSIFNVLDRAPGSFTEFNLINSTSSTVNPTLRLYDESGALLSTVNASIPARGRYATSSGSRNLSDIFSGVNLATAGHVEVQSSVGLAGNEMFGNNVRRGSLNSISVAAAATNLFSPQLVSGTVGFFTQIDVTNAGSSPATLTLRAFNQNGTPLGTFGPTTLNPRAKLSRKGTELGFTGTGWLKAESTAPVIGSVSFGDDAGNFIASLPMESQSVRSAIFSHVAQGLFGFFTGISILNPDLTKSIQVTLTVFKADGTQSAERTVTLAPGQRLSRLLDEAEYFGPSFSQAGGYVKLTSADPFFAFELFGTSNGAILSSVPANK
ncbi:MAG: matrixin family metalloprotease [Acidobacteria bacterium]|nr:matrixin family metalloprotease [Acidobacteriota bacterium]